jgi:hypothetical protein
LAEVAVQRERFIKALRDECGAFGWSLEVDKKLGKGSHYRLTVSNGRRTTLKAGDLSPLYMEIIRKQLGLR